MPEWDELEEVRRRQCRLGSDRWLADLEDAHSFLEDRHLLTLTPDCALPSLFRACEPVGDPEARGFAAWPGDKWWWGNALAERPGCLKTKLHRGKVLFLDRVAASVVDELCRAEQASACAGEHGVEAQRLVAFLQSAGPTLLDEVKANTGLDAAELRRVRARLESRGAVISREVTVDAASGGHRHVSELYLWSQSGTTPIAHGGLDALVQLAVRASVLASRSDVQKWFGWDVPNSVIDELVDEGRLSEPLPGWLTAEQ